MKVDFLLTPVDEVHKMLHKMAHFDHLKLLAEKVETYDEFEQALKLGFHYFQGFFFSKPELIRIGELPSVKVNLIRLYLICILLLSKFIIVTALKFATVNVMAA